MQRLFTKCDCIAIIENNSLTVEQYQNDKREWINVVCFLSSKQTECVLV